MGVDVIRAVRSDVAVLPNDLDVKIYVIEDAHTMTEQAQNALLLTLEEPPAFVLFLLLAERADVLLETIRSRAPSYRLQPLPIDTVAAYIEQYAQKIKGNATGQALEQVMMAADGSIGKALDLLSPKESAPILTARQAAMDFLDTVPAKGEHTLRALVPFGIRREDGKGELKRDEVAYKLQTLMRALRDLIAVRRCDPQTVSLCFFTDREAAVAYSLRYTMQDLLRLLEAVDAAYNSIAIRNANVKITLCDMAIRAGIL